MAPKTLYDAGDVQKKVTETAEKAFKTLREEGWEFSESTQLICEFLGAVTGGPPLSGALSLYPFGIKKSPSGYRRRRVAGALSHVPSRGFA